MSLSTIEFITLLRERLMSIAGKINCTTLDKIICPPHCSRCINGRSQYRQHQQESKLVMEPSFFDPVPVLSIKLGIIDMTEV